MFEIYPIGMLISIFGFALSTSMTPGPNNLMLLSSGLTFGYRRTIPHLLGIIFGFPLMFILIGLEFGFVFERYPQFLTILKVIGFGYLFWMAYKIATNDVSFESRQRRSKPFSFFQATLFQWVNPKAWLYTITSISIFVTSTQQATSQIILLSIIALIVAIISTNIWAMGGMILQKLIKSEKSIKAFNVTMAVILVVSLMPFMFE